jgi:uncharacterized OB-fold protein
MRSCGSRELEWVESSGRGRIYSVTVPRVVIGEMKAFEGEMPYAIAMVDLEEGGQDPREGDGLRETGGRLDRR